MTSATSGALNNQTAEHLESSTVVVSTMYDDKETTSSFEKMSRRAHVSLAQVHRRLGATSEQFWSNGNRRFAQRLLR